MAKVPGMPAVDKHDNMRLPTAAGQTFGLSALVVLDGSKNVTECGADPALIYGMALEPAGKDPEGAYTIVAPAFEGQFFWMPCSADPVIATHQNNSYGVAKDADGIWHVDFSDTTNKRVYVHQVDEDTKRVRVSVLEANRQISA
jgi:hypothetical protein